jgi:hypothetical protein
MAQQDPKATSPQHLEATDEISTTQYHHHPDEEAIDAKGTYVEDSDAKGYVDPSLIISEDENKILRNKIHRRWVCPSPLHVQ